MFSSIVWWWTLDYITLPASTEMSISTCSSSLMLTLKDFPRTVQTVTGQRTEKTFKNTLHDEHNSKWKTCRTQQHTWTSHKDAHKQDWRRFHCYQRVVASKSVSLRVCNNASFILGRGEWQYSYTPAKPSLMEIQTTNSSWPQCRHSHMVSWRPPSHKMFTLPTHQLCHLFQLLH